MISTGERANIFGPKKCLGQKNMFGQKKIFGQTKIFGQIKIFGQKKILVKKRFLVKKVKQNILYNLTVLVKSYVKSHFLPTLHNSFARHFQFPIYHSITCVNTRI